MRRLALLIALVGATAGNARAQKGFSIERYEPTPAGEWSFAIEHPWYTSSIYFLNAGLTFDYAHNPLVFGLKNPDGTFSNNVSVVQHQLVGHLDVAMSFVDRLLVSASIPMTLYENGTSAAGVSPISGVAAGDLRLGALFRIWGQPLKDPFSVHVGADLWIAFGNEGNHAGDRGLRVLPKLVFGGLAHHVLWSVMGGFQYRPEESIGNLSPKDGGNSVGGEVHLGAQVAYADMKHRFVVGPELIARTAVMNGLSAFQKDTTSLELLLGIQYNIAKQIQIGLAGGPGFLGYAGTPDGRVIFRIAYAPMREEKPKPLPPPPAPPPPPPSDRDHDGVLDADDLCPDVPKGDHPDPKRPGCPLKDTDADGVYDDVDQCPTVPKGEHEDKKRPGCPDKDTDGDGIFDSEDQCPEVPAGLHPDPNKLGCPLSDRDKDQVPDEVDACPDTPGAPSPDPKKNGCPGLVEIKEGKIVILQPVFFATDKDRILPKSFPVLNAVADALKAQPMIKRVRIEGHTDDRGAPAHNEDLSQRRAQSVMQFLIEHGIAAERLEARGYGQSQPVMTNKSAAGRAANRRVEFKVLDPAQQ